MLFDLNSILKYNLHAETPSQCVTSHCLPSSQCSQCSQCSERSASRAHLSEQFEARVDFSSVDRGAQPGVNIPGERHAQHPRVNLHPGSALVYLIKRVRLAERRLCSGPEDKGGAWKQSRTWRKVDSALDGLEAGPETGNLLPRDVADHRGTNRRGGRRLEGYPVML
ncbi:hypothetical protein FIBSPDRAFT_895133 [Athelia psychrophila]|uniref:Uncharacterized protein n=1 Tax=Athelia psychrophila TaxID=1759441 RepID=A0A166EYC3_9AGAM|nr:hypothetical protein FIBSPDRAFT_895133 [Fibularhizoctonia sp. CBS 109695]